MTFLKIDFKISTSSSVFGMASLVLRKNQLPSGGSCNINNFSGFSLETVFNITCLNWQDLDGSISKYEYFGK